MEEHIKEILWRKKIVEMESIVIDLFEWIFGSTVTYLILIISLYIVLIFKVRKIKNDNINVYKRNLHSHSIINYIDYINKYRIRNIHHSDSGKELIIRTLFKCFLDSAKKNVLELIHVTREKEFNNYKEKQLTDYINEKFENILKEYKMLFREKSNMYLDNKDIENVIDQFREKNQSHIISLGKLINDIINSNIYKSNSEIVNSILDLGLSSIIQISLNIENILEGLNSSLIGKTYKGEKINS